MTPPTNPKDPKSNGQSSTKSVTGAMRRASEARLEQLRREGEMLHLTRATGIRPEGAPFRTASPETGYYGLPAIKPPQWTFEIPIYFFVGGAAGAASVIAKAAEIAGADRKLISDARWIAAIGGAISPALLISDLGMPSRFLNMLRIFKVQSPMSVGSWTLVIFSSSSAMTAFAGALQNRLEKPGILRAVNNAMSGFAALSGLGLSTYTGVLIGATANPVWSEHVQTLPIHFAASGMGTAVSLLELRGHDHAALNLLGMGAAALKLPSASASSSKTRESRVRSKPAPAANSCALPAFSQARCRSPFAFWPVGLEAIAPKKCAAPPLSPPSLARSSPAKPGSAPVKPQLPTPPPPSKLSPSTSSPGPRYPPVLVACAHTVICIVSIDCSTKEACYIVSLCAIRKKSCH